MVSLLKGFSRNPESSAPVRQARSPRRINARHNRPHLVLILLAAAAVVALCAPGLLAADPISMNSQGDFVLSGDPSGSVFTPPAEPDIGVGGMGVIGRVGHQTGPTLGQQNSVTYVDANPYMFFEDTYVFGDGRLYIANNGNMGGSAGMGIRQFLPSYNSVLGFAAYYDRDNTRGVNFEQMGLSTELFTEWLDVRGNMYFPFGPKEQILGINLIPGSEAFVNAAGGVGSNITFQRRTLLASALKGFDVLFTVPVPGELAQRVNLEATAGFYNYVTAGATPDIWGFEARADADLFKKFAHLFLQFTTDPVFHDRLTFGADINYWHDLQDRPRLGKSQFNRIAQYVRRNRTVVASETSITNAPELAINPLTGNPYLVLHVRNLLDATGTAVSGPPDTFPAPAGNGSLATPFQFINEAQGMGADIIFVHADSVYDGTITGNTNIITMNPGEQILGEGVQQTISVVGLNQRIVLPRATAGTNRPVLRNVSSDAVTLASNSTFAGFDIDTVIGDGIRVGSVSNALVRDVRINNTTGNGITLNGTGGTVTFTDVNVNAAGQDGLSITNSSPTLVYSGTISNSVGRSLFVFDSSGTINLTGATITGNNGGRIVIGGAGGTTSSSIVLGDVTLTGAPGRNIDITNFSGTLAVPGDVSITNPGSDAIFISSPGLNSTVSFQGATTINGRNATGINVLNNQGNVFFRGDVTIGPPGSGGSPAVDYQGNTGNLQFGNLNINGSLGPNGAGIRIGGVASNSGMFTINGQTSIQNTIGNAIEITDDASEITFTGINIDNRTSSGIVIDNYSGTALFNGVTTISNTTLSNQSALIVQNSSGDVAFTIATINNAISTAAINQAGVVVQNNIATLPDISQISFGTLNVSSTNTTGVSFINNQDISVASGILNTTTGRAIELINNIENFPDNFDFDINFQSISATNSDFGIFVQDTQDPDTALDDTGNTTTLDVRRFTVSGINNAPNSGGTISNMSVAGARFDLTESNVDLFPNEKSGFVSLNFQTYQGNFRGIDMLNISQAAINLSTISNSASVGVNLLNVRQFVAFQNQFLSNGIGTGLTGDKEQFRALMSTVDNYVYDINGNFFIDQGGANQIIQSHMIRIATTAGGAGSTLAMLFRNQGTPGSIPGVTMNRGPSAALGFPAALAVQWAGPLAATVESNNFIMQNGANQIGTQFVTTQSGALADIVYRNNVLAASGTNATGFLGDFAGPTNLEISNNFARDANGNPNIPGFQFSGTNATGLDLSFRAPNNNVFINDNFITFNAEDATGIQFSTITGASSVQISGNTINLFNDIFQPPERGIFFQTVIGTIALSGAQNNVVTFGNANFTVPFFIPAGTSTGSILVNGSSVP